jgi:hypothetical protein
LAVAGFRQLAKRLMINEGMGFFCRARLISSCAFVSFFLGFCSLCEHVGLAFIPFFFIFFLCVFPSGSWAGGFIFLAGSGGRHKKIKI